MKMDVTIKAWEDNEAEYLREDIIREAANIVLKEVMRNQDHYGRTFRDNLEELVKEILLKEMSTDFKEEVKASVSEEMSKRYLRTKQAKELREEYGIETDSLVKSGLKDMISDIVKAEIKNCFK